MKRPKPIKPRKGEESVWDYPRPPALELFKGSVEVNHAGQNIVRTDAAIRILETSHPPVFYLPLTDVNREFLKESEHRSFCEWKGKAQYFHLVIGGELIRNAAWFYPEPKESYAALKNHVAIYPSKVDECLVNGEKAKAQEGDFYGGWITKNIAGPFKGSPGSFGW